MSFARETSVDLSPALVAELRKHKLQTQAKGKYVFQNSQGGFVDSSKFRARHWSPILKKAGVRPTRIHDLWHSFASQLVSMEMNMYYLMEQ